MTKKSTDKTPEQALAEDAAKSKALAATMSAVTHEQLEMNQLLGRIQATNAFGSMLETLSLAQLAQIKESKAYRKFNGQTQVINGVAVKLDTWTGFCKAIGTSERAVDEKLQNLQLLGEQALDNAVAIGMTTRELRKLRQLDASDQQAVIGELEVAIGDKEAIVELIEDMSVKHSKEKEALQQQLADEQAERKATDRVIADKDKKINELSKTLAREAAASPYDQAVSYAEEVAKLEVAMLAVFGDIDRLFDHIRGNGELPEILRVNQGQLLVALKTHANELLDRYQLGDITQDDDQLDWVAEAKKAMSDETQGELVD